MYLPHVFSIALLVLASPVAWCGDVSFGWKPAEAGKRLDARARDWFEFAPAERGAGATRSTCISCHSLLPFALARPALRKVTGTPTASDYEKKIVAQTAQRVQNWKAIDSAPFGLLYDFNEQKKKESWGTEAVLNAVVLAFDEDYQGRKQPSPATRQAFANLWKTQARAGADRGSWDWLDFNLEPWEAQASRYHGAAWAAIAVGTAPGYYVAGADPETDARVESLRRYLKERFSRQNLYNRAFALWAAARLAGVLTVDEQKQAIEQLLAKQQDDGGWGLPSLGAFVRKDGTPQETVSDGYATGLVVYVLEKAGRPKEDPRLARGLAWLRSHQAASGGWQTSSVNKKRNPATHVGQFMSDAATAYAVLALSHP
jgi:squalene-hopene/tetraprenyl-beta-curcumene cyclase